MKKPFLPRNHRTKPCEDKVIEWKVVVDAMLEKPMGVIYVHSLLNTLKTISGKLKIGKEHEEDSGWRR